MTKERLRSYLDLKAERDQLRQQLETIEAALYSPKAQRLTGMPASPSHGNAVEEMAARHLELMDRYRAKMLELAEEQLEIEKAIEALEPTERMLLRFRYIEGLPWEEVCVRMNYSWRQTHRMHSKALEALRMSDARSDDRA
jgi:DNA-directed RNA polymerase specialized sigma24 family protein